MSEDLIGKLGRFTPSATGIDRDEWLFRAGRASAPPLRWWKRAVGLLIMTQAATLAVLLARPAPEVIATLPEPTPASPAAVDEYPEPPGEPPASSSYLILARSDLTLPPRPGDSLPSSTPLPTLTARWRGEPID